MSQQQQQNNRFLLAHSTAPSANSATSSQQPSPQHQPDESFENQLSVDEDFDSYWEEEARNPHRNRIRIGRQYQATVPPLLKPNEKGRCRKLEDLETLSFCPKKSAKVSDAELDHYFTVAKSLNLFAELVETRSLLGRDVTIADLNRIKRKEGLSLASVIQPVRHHSFSSGSQPLTSLSPQQLQSTTTTTTTTTTTSDNNCEQRNSTSSSPKDQAASSTTTLFPDYPFNQPLMKALSHFISLHHPCHHDQECKKLLKDIPLEDNSGPAVSITAGNLRQGPSTKEARLSKSRASAKHSKEESTTSIDQQQQQDTTTSPPSAMVEQNQADNLQSPSYDDWTREEVELFSKAIEVCGKNFGSIKKEFLPSKSVMSIVEYYYIGSRDVSENKKKSNQTVETSDSCGSQEKAVANNNGQGGGNGPSGGPTGKGGSQLKPTNPLSSTSNNSSSRNTTTTSNNDSSNKQLSDSNETHKQISQSEIVSNLSNLKKQSSKTLQDQHNHHQQNGYGQPPAKTPDNSSIVNKNIDARMSIYNFDEEFRDDNSSPPVKFECPRPGAEVKPLKAKPIVPNATPDSEPSNSNMGSLKFFMDGQLVLKLNACQEQQEGIERCHWVQSGEKVINATRQKRYSKRAERSDSNQNGSQSNSVVSSFQDDDSKNDDLTGDEDSKESMNSFTNLSQQQKSQHGGSPTPKRLKIKSEPTGSQQQQQQPQQSPQLSSPINYNRLAVNNRMKERNDNLSPSSMINQASAMPWLQANSFAMAAALLKGLPFQPAPANLSVDNTTSQSNMSTVSMASKPMDLSLEHGSPKATLHKPSARSRGSRPKNV